jgi:hypothetical protein
MSEVLEKSVASEVAQAERLVKVYSTVGSNKSECLTSATVWEQLKGEMLEKGVLLNGMKAIVGGTEVTLESPNAQLPAGNFMLFLVPDKVKSGCSDHKEVSFGQEDEFGGEELTKEDILVIVDDAIESLNKVKAFLNGAQKSTPKVDTEFLEMKANAERLAGYFGNR